MASSSFCLLCVVIATALCLLCNNSGTTALTWVIIAPARSAICDACLDKSATADSTSAQISLISWMEQLWLSVEAPNSSIIAEMSIIEWLIEDICSSVAVTSEWILVTADWVFWMVWINFSCSCSVRNWISAVSLLYSGTFSFPTIEIITNSLKSSIGFKKRFNKSRTAIAANAVKKVQSMTTRVMTLRKTTIIADLSLVTPSIQPVCGTFVVWTYLDFPS